MTAFFTGLPFLSVPYLINTMKRLYFLSSRLVNVQQGLKRSLRIRIYIPQKTTVTVKNRLHARQQPCRSPRLTVIGIGLRKISSKFCLPSVRAARRHCRCRECSLFYFLLCLFLIHFSYVSPEILKALGGGFSVPKSR